MKKEYITTEEKKDTEFEEIALNEHFTYGEAQALRQSEE